MIRQLPPAPSRGNPGPFAAMADALLASLDGFVDDCNALEQSLIFVGTTGQSSTALAVGAGTKTLTASTGKAWVVGAWVHLVSAGGIGNVMVGQVLDYDVDTGELQVNVGAFAGSGTYSDWLIGLSSPQAPITSALIANGALAAKVGAEGGLLLPGDADAALKAVPKQQLDAAVAPLSSLSGRNRIINGTFAVNQRAFAGGALSAGNYGHDRWKAGSGGATYTVSGETATITVGTLVQVVEGLNVPEGGTYTLSWTGTAQARVDGGSYASSPITVTGKTAAANTTIEFGTGTVSNTQYEAGSSATTFERRLYSQEFAACQRYYWVSEHAVTLRGYGAGGGAQTFQSIGFPVRMRSSPTISASFSGATNTSAAGIASQGAGGFSLYVTSSGASDYAVTYSAGNTATSEL